MSNYVNNLNELINTKKELKDIIIESTGENPSEVFSYYPSYIRSAIAAGGGSTSEEAVNSYISAYLSTYNFIDQDTLSSNSYLTQHQDLSSYATKSYVVDYVATYAPTPDLSSYVTKTELSACGYITINDVPSTDLSGYVSKTELSAQSYITMGDVSACGYITSIPSEYITDTELSSMGYITSSDIPASVIIDENLSPKEDNMYDIGSNSYRYNTVNTQRINNSNTLGGIKLSLNNTDYYSVLERAILPSTTSYSTLGNNGKHWYATYTDNLYSTYTYTYNFYANRSYIGDINYLYNTSGSGLVVNRNGSDVCSFLGGANIGISPKSNNGASLGNQQQYWNATYTTNIYTENVSYTSGKASIKMNDRNIDFYANNKKMINLSDYNGFVPIQTNVNLGGSSNKWGSTYTANLYADTIHNFIWTGTSAEYAALDNYTTYQIYMIKES